MKKRAAQPTLSVSGERLAGSRNAKTRWLLFWWLGG